MSDNIGLVKNNDSKNNLDEEEKVVVDNDSENNLDKEGEVVVNNDSENDMDEEEEDYVMCPKGKIGGTLPADLEFSLDDNEYEQKEIELKELLQNSPVSQDELRKAALSPGGFVHDNIRKKAWPLVLGLTNLPALPVADEEKLKGHPEYQQVVLDVNRSLRRFPPSIPTEQRLSLQDQLTRLILRVVISHPRLRYYQGYHDVAVTLLLVTGENAAFFLLEQLSIKHLKDCMEPTMEKTSYLLNYIYPLVKLQHKQLYDYLEKAGLGTMFALPWFLTWFGHSLNRYKDVVRLYDYFLASEPLIPLYLSSVIVVYRAKEILQTPCDMASLHGLLSQIPDNLPFEKLIEKTTKLYKKFPPDKIEEDVKERIQKEQLQRQMEIARRQQRLRRSAPRMVRWLQRLDPMRRLPLFGFPQAHIPVQFRSLQFVMATAIALGIGAYYMRAINTVPFGS